MFKLSLVALVIAIVSVTAEARNVSVTGCPGVNYDTPYKVSFIKYTGGNFHVNYYIHGRRYPLASRNQASMRQINPDWSFVKGFASALFSIAPAGRLIGIIRNGARGAETIGTIRSPRNPRNEGHNGMTRSIMEICLVSANRALREQEGVYLNFASQGSLDSNLDLMREVMLP